MNNYDVATKAAKATDALQKARRGLEVVKQEEQEYLQDREQKAQALLAHLHKQIDSATQLLESTTSKVVKKTAEYNKRFNDFAKGLFSALKKTDTIMESSVGLRNQSEKLLETIKGKYEDLQVFEKKLGLYDKELVKREKAAKALHKKADEKLAEAKKLADWVKSGKRYKVKSKK